MCSYGPYHFFSAPRETVPIYTDKDNYLSKYESSKHGYKKAAIMSLTMIIVITLIKFLLGSKVERIIIINIVNFLVDFSVIGLLGVIIIGWTRAY